MANDLLRRFLAVVHIDQGNTSVIAFRHPGIQNWESMIDIGDSCSWVRNIRARNTFFPPSGGCIRTAAPSARPFREQWHPRGAGDGRCGSDKRAETLAGGLGSPAVMCLMFVKHVGNHAFTHGKVRSVLTKTNASVSIRHLAPKLEVPSCVSMFCERNGTAGHRVARRAGRRVCKAPTEKLMPRDLPALDRDHALSREKVVLKKYFIWGSTPGAFSDRVGCGTRYRHLGGKLQQILQAMGTVEYMV